MSRAPSIHPLAPEARTLAARDVASLLGCLALVVVPHALRAPWWLTLLTLCLFGWRLYIALYRAPLPSRWLVLAVSAVSLGAMWIQFGTLFGRQPGIVLLMLLSGLKMLESRTQRDGAVTAFLGYFLIITNLLYGQAIGTALLMGVALFAITATLIGFSAPGRAPRANLRTASVLLAQAAPAALVLFLLFPRVQGPLWGLPQDAYAGMTGLSETMSPGNLSSLAQSDAIAFRAEFEGDPPLNALRYWRGPVMWDFDGRTWSMRAEFLTTTKPQEGGSASYQYTVVLEPHNHTWLFALETAASVPERARMTYDGQILAGVPVRTRLRYEMKSVINPAPRLTEPRGALARALRLPAGYNPRALELAASWRAQSASETEILAKGLEFMRDGRFSYTLEPALLGTDSVDEFLFKTKEGFCEHFASAFVFLMRAAGVPARIVTGYQGGELNPFDRIVTVRQSDAHAWAEVFITGRGWVRVDPTAAAMPRRIESGLARAVADTNALPLLMRTRFEWLRSARYQWEALAHKWNVYVLGYNPDRQRDLMTVVGMRDADWRTLTAALFTILGLLTLALLAWSLKRFARPDPVQRAWRRFCAKLAARGVERAPHEGPRDYAARAARALPAARRPILRIGALYVGLRYGAQPSSARVARLRRMVRELQVT
jgi:transglutaminase-like putative cysteine protease